MKTVEFIQLVTDDDAWFHHHDGTENPRVGGSIPSLATFKPSEITIVFSSVGFSE
jgi:hypothetical protein